MVRVWTSSEAHWWAGIPQKCPIAHVFAAETAREASVGPASKVEPIAREGQYKVVHIMPQKEKKSKRPRYSDIMSSMLDNTRTAAAERKQAANEIQKATGGGQFKKVDFI